MSIKTSVKHTIEYLQDQEIDLRIRMLNFLEYALLTVCIIGSLVMLAFVSSLTTLIPNIVLIFFCVLGIYFSRTKKMYDIATIIIVCGCDYIALPYMFFTAGGNHSGMPLWFLFGLVFTCLMTKGRTRIIMTLGSLLISCSSMMVGFLVPDMVIPLENKQAEFQDMLQSFILVAIVLCLSLMMYLAAYDKQRKMLENKSLELKKAINTDPLTGVANRHAFYEDSVSYTDVSSQENLVLVLMDINGLKRVNDSLGHAAGDELIQCATEILIEAFSRYGNIYRTGGDEFVAILFCNDKEAHELGDILNETAQRYNQKNNTSVSIAIGTAIWNQNKDKSFFELTKVADTNMYQNKSEFYRQTGIDRRRR